MLSPKWPETVPPGWVYIGWCDGDVYEGSTTHDILVQYGPSSMQYYRGWGGKIKVTRQQFVHPTPEEYARLRDFIAIFAPHLLGAFDGRTPE